MVEEKKQAVKKKKRLSLFSMMMVLFVVVVSLLMLPTTIILIIGLIPTFVAAFTDQTKERTAMVTVGAMNFVGVLPALIKLWQDGHFVENALYLISQPLILLFMYGGAAAGAIIYFNTPPLVARFLKKKYANRLARIEKRQKELVAHWGDTVSGKAKQKKSPN